MGGCGGGWVKVGINTNSVELSLVGTELGKNKPGDPTI